MLRFLYVMDPLARVLPDKDTTFAFMLEGERRGHEQYQCGIEDLLNATRVLALSILDLTATSSF